MWSHSRLKISFTDSGSEYPQAVTVIRVFLDTFLAGAPWPRLSFVSSIMDPVQKLGASRRSNGDLEVRLSSLTFLRLICSSNAMKRSVL